MEAIVDPLGDEPVEVNGPAKESDMTLPEQSYVTIGRRAVDDDVEVLALLAKPFVQHDGASQVLVVVVDLLAQLVDELVEAQVDLKGTKKYFLV